MANLSTYFPQRPDYTPAMMQFDGSTADYTASYTSSGNAVTMVFAFKRGSIATNFEWIGGCTGPTHIRFQAAVGANDAATVVERDKLVVYGTNSSGTQVVRVISKQIVTDDVRHICFVSYNGTTGAVTFIIDGQDADDTAASSRILTTATLDSGASSNAACGDQPPPGGGGTKQWSGEIGFFGIRDAYLTNWQDFIDANGNPKALDEFRWTQWGGGTPELPYQVFNGSTGYFEKSSVTLAASNKFTCVGRFKHPTAGAVYQLVQVDNGTYVNTAIEFYSDNRLRLTVWNSTGTIICQARVDTAFDDDVWHTFFFTFDGDTGAVSLIVDGVERWESGWGPNINTTGTLPSGGTSYITVGRDRGAIQYWNGECAFFGYAQVGGLSWGDFMDATGLPQEIDELNWTEWGGAKPLVWNRYCQLDDNKGSVGNLTRNGTVTHTTNSQPLFWHEAAKMDEQLGSAGVMTENGTIILGKGGN